MPRRFAITFYLSHLLLWLALVRCYCEHTFSFDYSHHGEDWSQGECASRDRQSPIDFADATAPWTCKPPVLDFLKATMGEEHFNTLGFDKLADHHGAAASAAASMLQSNKSRQPSRGMSATVPSTKPPMTVVGCPHLHAFYFRYDMAEKALSIQNNGHAITLDLKGHGLGSIHWDGYNYDVLSVNFHVHSEHTFKGKPYPLELHIVHREPETNRILVVAIPFDAPPRKSSSLFQRKRRKRGCGGLRGRPDISNEPCAPLDPVAEDELLEEKKAALAASADLTPEDEALIASNYVPSLKEPAPSDPGYCEALQNLMSFPLPKQGETRSVPLRNGPVDLISPLISGPADSGKGGKKEGPLFPQGFFQYSGSLTAPPCTEQVSWLVRKDPIVASQSQIELLRVSVLEANSNFANARSVMPLMGRSIQYSLAVQGDPPKPPQHAGGPSATPDMRKVEFRGVKSGQEAMMKATAASRAKDMIVAGVGHAQQNFADAGAETVHGLSAQRRQQSGGDPPASPNHPTANPERVLSRIVDAVSEQMDGAEKSAALAAAGVH